jgi:hypothetical protein
MNVLINITYQGQSGNYIVDIDPSADDATIKHVCEEAIRSNEVNGISNHLPCDPFANFVIDRFNGDPVRFVLRPKVPFGAQPIGARIAPPHPGGVKRN